MIGVAHGELDVGKDGEAINREDAAQAYLAAVEGIAGAKDIEGVLEEAGRDLGAAEELHAADENVAFQRLIQIDVAITEQKTDVEMIGIDAVEERVYVNAP